MLDGLGMRQSSFPCIALGIERMLRIMLNILLDSLDILLGSKI